LHKTKFYGNANQQTEISRTDVPLLTQTDQDIHKMIANHCHNHSQRNPTKETIFEKREEGIIHPLPCSKGVGQNQRDLLLALGLSMNASKRKIKTKFRRC
jgi:hypothetical protein